MFVKQSSPCTTGTIPSSGTRMTSPVTVVAQRHQVLHIIAPSISQVLLVVDLDAPQALALAALALVAVPREYSTA